MNDTTDWRKHWEDGRTPWDLGSPHAATRYLANCCKEILSFEFKGKDVVIPGAGRGHDAKIFLERGALVTAVDLSQIACDEARKLYGRQGQFSTVATDINNYAEKLSVILFLTGLCFVHYPRN